MGALDGVVVADFSRVLAGPLATMHLADLGADVIKVERPGSGDDTRAWPPFLEDGTSTYYSAINRNKRSVALDLQSESDLKLGKRLADRADVVIENFRPGVMGNLGLDYETVSASNPGVVYCSITGFGSSGAGAELPGFDFLVQAMGGIMSLTGPEEGPPYRAGVAIVDVLAGLHALSAITAALYSRASTGGKGQHVEIALMQSLLAGLVNASSAQLLTGQDPVRAGNRHASVAPYETFEASDGSFIIATGNDRQFQRLCEVIGAPELAADDRFVTNGLRVGHIAELGEALAPYLRTRPRSEWIAELLAARVPAGQVNTISQAFQAATEIGLEPVVELADGFRTPRPPFRLSETPPEVVTKPPTLGEHSEEIRAWLQS